MNNKKKFILPQKCEVCDILAVQFELMEKKIRKHIIQPSHQRVCNKGLIVKMVGILPFMISFYFILVASEYQQEPATTAKLPFDLYLNVSK